MPFSAVGEICFAGKGVVAAAICTAGFTSEKFVEREGLRFYQTGDMGRLHPDGNVEILGRRDYQVQLRGIRVELPGIENTVREIGLAEQCAVVLKKLSDQDVRLVAFVVKPRETTIAAFRHVLAAHLPDYMLPQTMVAVDACPSRATASSTATPCKSCPGKASRAKPRDRAAQRHRASYRVGFCQEARRPTWALTTISSIAEATRCSP